MKPKVVEPAEFNVILHQFKPHDETGHAFNKLREFCDNHKQWDEPPIIDIPKWWAGVVLNCLSRLVVVEPEIKLNKISHEDGKLVIHHNYCPRSKEKIDEIKINASNNIDKLILQKVGEVFGL